MKNITHCLCAILGAGAFVTATSFVANLRRELSVFGRTEPLLDLSEPFEKSPLNNESSCAKRMIDLSVREPEIRGLLVLEHGKIVVEYSAVGEKQLPIWSCTKTFTALLLGVLVKDGYLSLTETLGEIFDYDPYDVIWGGISDAESRKALTIESILTMTAGLSLPDVWLSDFMWPFDYGVLGGSNLVDSLGYHKLNPSQTDTEYEYLFGGNLLSYVIAERTRMSPEEFAQLKVFPLLGITESDYDWQHNLDGVSYAWHGIFTTTLVMAKLRMLYLQHGLANSNNTIVDETFVLDSTKGTVLNDKYGYGLHLIREAGVDPVYPERATRYFAGGFGANAIGVDEDLGRVIAVVSNNYLPEGLTEHTSAQLAEIMNDPECTFLEE